MNTNEIYKHIDYTNLKPTVTRNDIWDTCADAYIYECASICIPSHFVKFAKEHFPTLNLPAI